MSEYSGWDVGIRRVLDSRTQSSVVTTGGVREVVIGWLGCSIGREEEISRVVSRAKGEESGGVVGRERCGMAMDREVSEGSEGSTARMGLLAGVDGDRCGRRS